MAEPLQLSQLRGFLPWDRVAFDSVSLGELKGLVLPALISLFVGWAVWHVVYNLYFHPLAKFPGPKLAAISPLWIASRNIGGRAPFDFKKAHDHYGPILRVAPNELSVSDAGAWKEIYGHHPRDKTFIKGNFYNTNQKTYGARHIVTEKDFVKHAEMRRMLSHAFSSKALMEQEPVIQSYVDLLIKGLTQRYAGKERGPDGERCNMVNWYNYTTFDIIGDLAFGDAGAFACLQEERPHPFVQALLGGVFVSSLHDSFRRIPGATKLGYWLTPNKVKQKRVVFNKYCRDLVAKRLEADTDRPDFWRYILNREESKDLTVNEMAMQAQVIIIAGSETTATLLSGLTYYLLKTPRVFNLLKEEIRSTFRHYDDINAQNTNNLHYLNAVLEEGMRMYPPVPIGLPRTSPGATVAGHYIPRGTDIAVHMYSVTRDKRFWSKPEEFYPERWIDPKNTDKKEASQPFSLGPRVCLGKNLAYMELRVILSKMLYAFDLELVDKNLDWEAQSSAWVLWWKPELNMKITKRPGLEWTSDGLPL